MRFSMTPEDFLRGRILPPGFYPAVIYKAEEVMSKGGTKEDGTPKDKVQMMKVEFKVTDGEYKGNILYMNYPENFAKLAIDLMSQAFGVAVDPKKGVNLDMSPANLQGKTLDLHVIKGSYNGKPKNEIDGYRPYTGKGTGAPAQAGV